MYTQKDVQELDEFFKASSLPTSVAITTAETITDVKKFVDSHLTIAKANVGSNTYSAFYMRLIKLKDILSEKV